MHSRIRSLRKNRQNNAIVPAVASPRTAADRINVAHAKGTQFASEAEMKAKVSETAGQRFASPASESRRRMARGR